MLPFVLINALVLAKPPWFIGHKETSCVHQERGAAVCLEDLAQFPGLLGLGLLQLLPLFCEAFQALGPAFSFTSSVTAGCRSGR